MAKNMKKSKIFKMTGNLPTISFAIFLVLAISGILMFNGDSNKSNITGYEGFFIEYSHPFCTISSDHTICTNTTGTYGPSCKDSISWAPYSCDGTACMESEIGWLCSASKPVCSNGACVAASACTTAGGICRDMMMGGTTCNPTNEVDSELACPDYKICCVAGTPPSDTCTPAGGKCSFDSLCASNYTVDATKVCSNGTFGLCCMPSTEVVANSSVSLISPDNNANFTVPETIKFKWMPVNFTKSDVFCAPVAWKNETQIYPESAGNLTLIPCKNNENCSWTSQSLNDSLVGEWLWLAGCSADKSDFDEEKNWTNVTVSGARILEIVSSKCEPKWLESTWAPAACSAGDIQSKTYIDQNSCGIAPNEITCTTWTPGTSTCILKKNCEGGNIEPSGIAQITDWKPYPCVHEQWAIFQMQNGTTINQTRNCCTEKWNLEYGACVDGMKTGTLSDENGCDTSYDKPKESAPQSCSFFKSKKFYIIAGAFAFALVLTIILFASHSKGRKKPSKSASESEEDEEEDKKDSGKSSEVDSYIKKAFIKGMSKAQIRKQLLDAGWPKKTVDDALKA